MKKEITQKDLDKSRKELLEAKKKFDIAYDNAIKSSEELANMLKKLINKLTK